MHAVNCGKSNLPMGEAASGEPPDDLVSRIWDLRRGDHDDDRMSPFATGFRSLVLSAAFEFNFFKALIVFLFLLVLPALLVGIALGLCLTYSSMLRHNLAATGRSPIPAIVTIAALIVFAIFAGRPLLRVAFNNLRRVHYTLVFPVFVALRELLRMVAERLHGRSITLKQLNRGRRIGAIAAALIFAVAGLALAWGVWSSFGLQHLTFRHLHPWELTRSALINAAIVFGVSTIFDSLSWLHQELIIGGSILNWTPDEMRGEQTRTARIAHLSDLHLVGERYGYRMETGTHGPQGNSCIGHALRRLTELQAAAPLDHIFVTGDVTDAGTRAEWAEFIDLLRDCPGLRQKLSFVPGNHDTMVVDRTNVGRLDLPWSSSQLLRKLRVLLALEMVQGQRTYVVDRSTGKIGQSLSEFLRDGNRAEWLRSLATRGSWRGRWEVEKAWDAVFPLVEPAKKGGGYGVMLLDSNAGAHLSLTNAIGFISPTQLRAVKSVLRNYSYCSWIIALHHHVVEYPVQSVSLRDRISLALVNASDFLAAIRPYARQVVVLHGHRHTDWIGMYGDTVLCSAPSAAFGSHSDPQHRGNFRIHKLGLSSDGGIILNSSELVYVERQPSVTAEAEARPDDRAA